MADINIPEAALPAAISCLIEHSDQHIWWRPWKEVSERFHDQSASWIAPSHEIIRGRDFRACASFSGRAFYQFPFELIASSCINIEAIIDGLGSFVLEGRQGALASEVLRHGKLNSFEYCLAEGAYQITVNHHKNASGPTAGFIASIADINTSTILTNSSVATRTFLLDAALPNRGVIDWGPFL